MQHRQLETPKEQGGANASILSSRVVAHPLTVAWRPQARGEACMILGSASSLFVSAVVLYIASSKRKQVRTIRFFDLFFRNGADVLFNDVKVPFPRTVADTHLTRTCKSKDFWTFKFSTPDI